MPEMTEVETVRRELESLRGARILRVVSRDSRVFKGEVSVAGRRIQRIERRGKWLRWTLDQALVFSHMGMTGDWTLCSSDAPELPAERVRVDVERGQRQTSARYTDSRRFGRFITTARDIGAWRELGPDPLEDGIDVRRLFAVAQRRPRSSVKELLMDQSVLAGVGNILAVEGLWNARVDPRSRARRLKKSNYQRVAKGLLEIIHRTLEYDLQAARGEHREAPFQIYGRAGLPCPRCHRTLRQIVIGGRGTVFCPGCQRRI